LQCVAVCCSVLQCVAVCCSVLQCVAVCCSVLQHKCAPTLQHTPPSTLQPCCARVCMCVGGVQRMTHPFDVNCYIHLTWIVISIWREGCSTVIQRRNELQQLISALTAHKWIVVRWCARVNCRTNTSELSYKHKWIVAQTQVHSQRRTELLQFMSALNHCGASLCTSELLCADVIPWIPLSHPNGWRVLLYPFESHVSFWSLRSILHVRWKRQSNRCDNSRQRWLLTTQDSRRRWLLRKKNSHLRWLFRNLTGFNCNPCTAS